MNLDALTGRIPDAVIRQIPDVEEKFEINTTLRLAHFLSQCGHESAGFTAVTKRVNGGTLGLDDRAKRFNEYFPLLSDISA